MAESFLVGSYFIMVILISRVLLVKYSSIHPTHRLLFCASIFMFLISVAHLGLVMQELTVTIIPKANGQAQVVLATVQYVTGDLILIWRVWVVWGYKYWIAFPPAGLLMAAAGLTLHQLASANFFTIAPVSLIVANTSLCTGLIFGRVWYVERKAVKASTIKCTTGIWKGSVILFIESGVLYTFTQLLSLFLSYKQAIALPVLLNLEMPLIGILPSLIILVVHYDLRHSTQIYSPSPASRNSLVISRDGRHLGNVSNFPSPRANPGDIWREPKDNREENVWRV